MGFFDKPVNSTHTLVGTKKPFNFKTKKYDLPFVTFNYQLLGNSNEEIVEALDDLQTVSSDLTIGTYTKFKTKDKAILQDGSEVQISNVQVEPDPNFYNNKYIKYILFME